MEVDNKIIAAITSVVVAIIGIFRINVSNSDGNQDYEIAKLKNHPVHQRLKNFKNYIEFGIEADLKGKELLVKDFLINTFSFYEEKIKELAYEVDDNDLTQDEIQALNEEYFNCVIEDMITYFYVDNYNDEEIKALKILAGKFQKFYYKKSENFLEEMCEIANSNYYKNPKIIQAIIFDKYIGLFATILSWFDEVIDVLNGEFEGLEFQGEVITDEDFD
jgi:hypothetical protein